MSKKRNETIGLREATEPLLERLEAANQSRDRALNEGRQIVRMSANAVRAIHRGELEGADALLAEAGDMLGNLLASIEDPGSIRSAGYMQDAMKEYAEARITLALESGRELPDPLDLGIDDAPYLNALAESASELRRLALDVLRGDDFARAERYLEIMDEIYRFLVTVDYPDGLTGGLRRSTDALRAVLERTRGDLTLTGAQNRLHAALREAIGVIERNA